VGHRVPGSPVAHEAGSSDPLIAIHHSEPLAGSWFQARTHSGFRGSGGRPVYSATSSVQIRP
jgi:hypothetical protein